MHDFVELDRDQVIDLRDPRIDHRLRVVRRRSSTFEHLGDELFDQVPATIPRRGIGPKRPCVDDLVEEAYFLWSPQPPPG